MILKKRKFHLNIHPHHHHSKKKAKEVPLVERLLPIHDEAILISRKLLTYIIEDAMDKSLMKEYIKKAPEAMSNFLLSFTESAMQQAFPNVEKKENVENVFGQNINKEPAMPVVDSWIRRNVKTIKKKEKKRKISVGIQKVKKDVNSPRKKKLGVTSPSLLNSARLRKSFAKSKLGSDGKSRSNSKSRIYDEKDYEKILNEMRGFFVIPEPVQIDYEIVEDNIARQRKKLFF